MYLGVFKVSIKLNFSYTITHTSVLEVESFPCIKYIMQQKQYCEAEYPVI